MNSGAGCGCLFIGGGIFFIVGAIIIATGPFHNDPPGPGASLLLGVGLLFVGFIILGWANKDNLPTRSTPQPENDRNYPGFDSLERLFRELRSRIENADYYSSEGRERKRKALNAAMYLQDEILKSNDNPNYRPNSGTMQNIANALKDFDDSIMETVFAILYHPEGSSVIRSFADFFR